MPKDLYIRTQYDGKDLICVLEVYSIDEDGEDQIEEDATSVCIGIPPTCADQGDNLWSWLREQVEDQLRQAGISYQNIFFDDEP